MTTFSIHFGTQPTASAFVGRASTDAFLLLRRGVDEVAISFPTPDDMRQVLDEALQQAVALCMTPDDRQAELFAEAEDAA